jgi:hypothetical protein
VKSRSNQTDIHSAELAAGCDGNNQAEGMDAALGAVLKVPHSAVLKNTAKRRRARTKKEAT